MSKPWTLAPDRCFDPEPTQRGLARELYGLVVDQPIVSPHGHIDPRLLADPQARLGSPSELLITPDHYVLRMLYSQGVPLEALGVPTRDGTPVETNPRQIWQRFAEHFHLFRGTPTGLWLSDELIGLFGVQEKLDGQSAQRIYDQVAERLAQPEYTPRALLHRFNIAVLCTTDAATDTLGYHQTLRDSGWDRRIRPTFRPDQIMHLHTPGWRNYVEQLGALVGFQVGSYAAFIRAIEARRTVFRELGAVATDHAALTPYTERLSPHEAEAIVARALRGAASADDATRFTGHMLLELARMSCEDGLVMQLHVGSLRDHHEALWARFGPDKGADIPVQTEWTRNLRPLLNAYGADPRYRLILFTLDESSYSRELAPLAGHYPAVVLGAPWWFFDSVNGINRYFELVIETAGFANTVGFNDDTRAFASIGARHDLWRRVTCNWLAGQVARGLLDQDDASELALDCAWRLAQRAYRLPEPQIGVSAWNS
jgi:glucuronate isomerase